MAKTVEAAEAPTDDQVETSDGQTAPDDFKTRATVYVLEPIAVALARTPDAGTASNSDIKGALRSVQETIRRMLAGPDAVPAAAEEPVAEAEPEA